MNITDNLTRIKEGKDNIIKSLKNKGVSINDNTLINEIPTIIDNAEIGGGGGDTPSQPETPELVQKYEGASVFRIVVPTDNYEFAINLCNNASTATYDVDWGDGSLESGLTTDEQHHTYSKKGIYDVNIYNISKDITLGGSYQFKVKNENVLEYIYFLFNNTNNAIWSGTYIENKDYICTNILIGKGIKSIGKNAFNNYYSLQSIVITEGVTTIGESAFSDCYSLQSIVIPNTVTIIENSAIRYCSLLTSITIPNSVTSIKQYAFDNCRSLTSVTIPNSVTTISDYTFSNCSSLTSVTIPNSVTTIGNNVFEYCSSLTSVTIPNSVTTIGSNVFRYCNSLTSVTIPNSVTSIGSEAFEYCRSLTSVTIPNSVTSIGSEAFEYCSSLTSVTIPDSVTLIGSRFFSNCSSLTSVTIPNSVTSIGSEAFSYCHSLQTITIPDSVTIIENSAIRICYSLQNIVIPNSVTTIRSEAFNHCRFLQSITCKAMTAPTIQNSSFPTSSLNYSKRYLYVPKDSVGYNEEGSLWKTYLIDKGWELRYIEDRIKTPTTLKLKTTNNFFQNLQAIGQANLVDYELINDEYIYNFDDKITELTQYTFYDKVLEEIELPEGLEIIRDNAFYGYSSLQSIVIPDSVTTIGDYGFNNCSNLHTITCKAMTAPTIQSNTFSSVGSKVPSGTPKILRVPEGAEGYDVWLSKLSGFTLEYIPLSEL